MQDQTLSKFNQNFDGHHGTTQDGAGTNTRGSGNDHLPAPYAADPLCREIARLADERTALVRRLNPGLLDLRDHCPFYMDFYIACSSLADLSECRAEVLLSYARESALHDADAAAADIPFRTYLNDVAWYRVNSEQIADARPALRELLHKALANEQIDTNAYPRSAAQFRELVLAVNRVCASEVCYQASDERTLDPLALLRRVFGRCGEESTFLVSMLRALGIPARQIYAPLWAHCDDNHAWVEAWAGEDFAFLGACEPEPVLNRGWFTDASSRAPLILTRSVLPYDKEPLLARQAGLCLSARTAFYAPTRRFAIKLRLPDGSPAAGRKVDLRLLNYAERASFIQMETDADGQIQIDLGLCSFWAEAEFDGLRAEAFYAAQDYTQTAKGHVISIELSARPVTDAASAQTSPAGSGQQETPQPEFFYCLCAEPDSPHHISLGEAQKHARADVLKRCADQRNEKLATFHPAINALRDRMLAVARDEAPHLHRAGAVLTSLLQPDYIGTHADLAYGHAPELLAFLDRETANGRALEALILLLALRDKEWSDMSADVLRDTLDSQQSLARLMPVLRTLPDADALRALLSPRISNEPLHPYRLELSGRLRHAGFDVHKPLASPTKAPRADRKHDAPPIRELRAFLAKECPSGEAMSSARFPFRLSLARLMALKQAGPDERELLLAACLRLLGHPARYNPTLRCCEYLERGRNWTPAPDENNSASDFSASVNPPSPATLRLVAETKDLSDSFIYNSSWSLSLNDGDGYRPYPADYLAESHLPCRLELPAGRYEICTTLRLPNGCSKLKRYRFVLTAGQSMQLTLQIPQAETYELLHPLKLDPSQIRLRDGSEHEIPAALNGRETLLLRLNPWEEPSVHVLSELLESAGALRSDGPDILLVLNDESQEISPVLRKVMEAFPDARLASAEPEEQEARGLFIDPDQMPRGILIAPDGRSVYAFSGYQVGCVNLILRLHESLKTL